MSCSLGFSTSSEARPRKSAVPKVAPMRVLLVKDNTSKCEPLCAEWISAEGGVTADTPAAFRSVFNQLGKRKLPILISSGGGSVDAGYAIAKMIRERQLEIVVAKTQFAACTEFNTVCKLDLKLSEQSGRPMKAMAGCASACALILAGGVKRHLYWYSAVGVHQMVSYQSKTNVMRQYQVRYRMVNGRKQEISRELISEKRLNTVTYAVDTPKRDYNITRDFYVSMGISKEIMPLLEGTPHESIHWMTASELKSTGMITDTDTPEVVISLANDAARAASFTLDAYGTQVAAAKTGSVGTQLAMGHLEGKPLSEAVEFWHAPGSPTVDILLSAAMEAKLARLFPATVTLTAPNGLNLTTRSHSYYESKQPIKITIADDQFCNFQKDNSLTLSLSAQTMRDFDSVPVRIELNKIKGMPGFMKAVCKDAEKPATVVAGPLPEIHEWLNVGMSGASQMVLDTWINPAKTGDALDVKMALMQQAAQILTKDSRVLMTFPYGISRPIVSAKIGEPMVGSIPKQALCSLKPGGSIEVKFTPQPSTSPVVLNFKISQFSHLGDYISARCGR